MNTVFNRYYTFLACAYGVAITTSNFTNKFTSNILKQVHK